MSEAPVQHRPACASRPWNQGASAPCDCNGGYSVHRKPPTPTERIAIGLTTVPDTWSGPEIRAAMLAHPPGIGKPSINTCPTWPNPCEC